jgi:ABC-type branched-subunit amino acid transport system permease subunit
MIERLSKTIVEYIIILAILSLVLFGIVMVLKLETLSLDLVYLSVIIALWILLFKFSKTRKYICYCFDNNTFFKDWAIVVLLILLPVMLRGNVYLIHILIMIELYTMMAIGLNIYLGSFGMVNFCFGAYFGIGAYTSAILVTKYGFPFILGLILACVAGMLIGILISFVTLKNKGFYYILVTLAFQLIFNLVVNDISLTGGSDGIVNIPVANIGGYSLVKEIKLLGITLPFQANIYYMGLIICIITAVIVRRLNVSWTVMTWNAVRDDEIAAECQGINIFWKKIEASVVGATLGALAGPIYAHYVGYISPEVFTWQVSAVLLSMIILGGVNNIFGVIVGVCILTVFTEKFQIIANFRTLIYGLIILLFLIFKPIGLIPGIIRTYTGLNTKRK